MRRIPITIGITGHRDIRPDAAGCLKSMVTNEILNLTKKYDSSEFVMVDALASGADLMCVDVAMELGIKLVAVLPFDKSEYLKDFEENEAEHFKRAFSYASRIVRLDIDSDVRDDHYRKVGEYIAECSHITFALWDGKITDPAGCGTGGIVHYMMHLRPSYSIYHFLTPRSSDSFSPELKVLESETGITAEMLEVTNEFNSDSTSDDLYASADALSADNQKKYNVSLITLACAGVLMVLAFLLYDELYMTVCLFIYALLLIGMGVFLKFVRKRKYHEKYYRYRMFAESLRVQNALRGIGNDCNSAESYTWTQQDDVLWIKKALDSVCLVTQPDDTTNVPDWIGEQLAYHQRAVVKTEKKKKFNDFVSRILIVLTALLIFAGCVAELTAPQIMCFAVGNIDTGILYRSIIGTLSAGSLFLSSYYGKLALDRKTEDHRNMIKLYSRAERLISEGGLTNSVALAVAREEIIENGNWYSYIKENTPDINI